MSNVHGFHNLGPRAQPAGGPRGAAPGVQQGYAADPEVDGISFVAPPPRQDGMQPELSERLLPWSLGTFVFTQHSQTLT